MMKPKIRFFSLLEILIAMMMAMGVLVTGLYFYRYAAHVDAALKKEERSALRARMLSARLSQVFTHLYKKPFFMSPEQQGLTRGPSLVFSFDDQSRNPVFRGKALARLLVLPDKRLLLVFWDFKDLKNSQPPMHLEVLSEGIDGMEFEFLVGEVDEGDSSFPELRAGSFLPEWRAEYSRSPAAIKLRLKGDHPLEFAFPVVGRQK